MSLTFASAYAELFLMLCRQQLLPSLWHRPHMLPRPQLQTPLQPPPSPLLSTLHSLCGLQQVSLHLVLHALLTSRLDAQKSAAAMTS